MTGKTVYTFPSQDKATLPEVGGKGLSLMIGSQQGLPVPPGFILTVAFFNPWLSQLKSTEAWSHFLKAKDDELKKVCDALKDEASQFSFTNEQQQEVFKSIEQEGRDALFAVRSSSPEEDLEASSFAGGYETVLGVTVKNIEDAVKRAFASCLDYRVAVYKRENSFNMTDPRIAVVVQKQIGSDIAGVGFSLNPINNNYDDAVFNANWGLGETVVAGIATSDTFIADKVSMQIKNRMLGSKEKSIWLMALGGTEEKPHHRSSEYTLSDSQIIELTVLIKKVEQLYAKPIDIEWAYEEDTLYLLQARPISAYMPLSQAMLTSPGARKRLYVDFTISAQGIDRPMSVAGTSFFRSVITIAGKKLFFRDVTRDIDATIPWIENGRMYVNLSTILRLFDKSKIARFMQILDPLVAKTIETIDEKEYVSRTNRLWLLPLGILTKLPRIAIYIYKAKRHPEKTHHEVQKNLRLFANTVRAIAEKETSLTILADKLMRVLVDRVFLNTVPLFIIGKNALKKMKIIAGKDQDSAFAPFEVALPHNVTTEMGLALYRVSQLLPEGLDKEKLESGLEENSLPEAFISGWKDFLKVYGHRGPLEVDVAAPRYRDDPALLLNLLMSLRNTREDDNPQQKFEQSQKERALTYKSLFQKIHARSSTHARRFQSHYKIFETFAGYRETHKSYLAFVTDLVRERILLEAKVLYDTGRLKSIDQVFDLTLEDLDRAKTDATFDLTVKAKSNRTFIDRLLKVPRLPAIIDSRGRILRPPPQPAREGEVAGTPISSGVVRGHIKILHSPNEKTLNKGEILVARATDPGWTPLFVNAAAVILEVGGLLQHGALVAREYGLPCVAGIENATTLWKDGTLVEVDGSAGIVRLVASSEVS